MASVSLSTFIWPTANSLSSSNISPFTNEYKFTVLPFSFNPTLSLSSFVVCAFGSRYWFSLFASDKIGCFFKGIGQTAVNMVKGAIQHPIKTALMIGASFIPVEF